METKVMQNTSKKNVLNYIIAVKREISELVGVKGKEDQLKRFERSLKNAEFYLTHNF